MTNDDRYMITEKYLGTQDIHYSKTGNKIVRPTSSGSPASYQRCNEFGLVLVSWPSASGCYMSFAQTYMLTDITFSPRTAGGLSHFRTAGRRTRKLRKIAKSGKRRSIGRGEFYKKYLDHFIIRPNLRSQVVKKGQIFSKSGYFHRKSQLFQ